MDECRHLPPVCNRYQRAAELLGRRWSAAVIRAAMEGPARFTEIRGSVEGLSARLLAERLRELEAAGLMERRALGGGAVEYRLTEKGQALTRVVREIEAWVAAWDDVPPQASAPVSAPSRPSSEPPQEIPMSMSDQVRALLTGRAFAHLATVLPDGSPHSVPVWIDVDENDRLIMFTQTGSRKARNIERDARVAISVVDIANPYHQCDLRGRVVSRIDGERALAIADALSVKYTGAAFPWRSPNTVVYSIEPEVSHHAELPFTHQ